MSEPEHITNQQENSGPVTRVIDFKIPLHWLLGVCGVIGWALISTYFKTDQLVLGMSDLQIAVKSGNNSVTAVAGELALQKFRLQNVEDSAKRNSDAIIALQKNNK